MKKLVVMFFASLILCANAYADNTETISTEANKTKTINMKYVAEAQNKINEIGFKILNYNGIEKRMVFNFDTKNTKKVSSHNRNRKIVVYMEIYKKLTDDDEIASVLAHEIAHGVDSYNGVFNGYFSSWSYALAPRKYEYKADKMAVDYMVNAGYNPLAMIVVLSKTLPQARYDWYAFQPLTSRRMMRIYEYVYKKYPEYLANNVYKDNVYYQNFLLTSKTNRAKFQKKIESGSKKAVNYQ